jgi:UV DNA damage repair endonuclease
MTDIVRKVGFACKFVAVNNKGITESVPGMNTGGTTLTYLKKAGKNVAERKMWEVMETNIGHTHNLVRHVSKLRLELRMLRLTSDMMTGYTHEDWEYFYKLPDVTRRMEELFAPIGELARSTGTRLSFHPGQFTVLASETDRIVDNSIKEFEYHVDMARMMGYGSKFQDFKINVHISGRKGPQGIIDVLPRLSPEARNMITIENDEMTWGLDASLELVDHVALVLDIHHHWVRTGEYIEATDDRIKRVIDSWRGVRPVCHYSVSREDCLIDHCKNTMPDLNQLLETGYKKQKLRAHSDMYWNHAVNQWAATHNEWADTMCESKSKNLASFEFFENYIKEKTNVQQD